MYKKYTHELIILIIGIIGLILISLPIVVKAESGSITASKETDITGVLYFGGTTAANAISYNKFVFYVSNYNTLTRYVYHVSNPAASFPDQANSTTFTIASGGTGHGYVSYDKASQNITWTFSSDTRITSSPFTVSYAQNIFANWDTTQASRQDSLSASIPMGLANNNNELTQIESAGDVRHIYFISSATTINYTITYDSDGNYHTFIDKSGSAIATKVNLTSATIIQFTESTYNKVNYSIILEQLDKIYINVSMSNGGHNNVLINSTDLLNPNSGSISGTILSNRSSYNLTQIAYINYTLNNTDNGRIRITDSNGNTYIYPVTNTSGINTTLQWYIPEDSPIGEYIIYLDYYQCMAGFSSCWQNLDLSSFNVLPLSGESSVNFVLPNYLLSDIATVNYYANGSNYYIQLLDSNNIIKFTHNITASESNSSEFFTYSFKQTDLLGTWTTKLFNNSGVLFASDTSYINYAVVNSSPVVTTTEDVNDTSLIAIPALVGKLTIGEFDVDSDNTLIDSPHNKNIGMNILYTLLLLVGIIFIAGSYKKIKR